MGQKIIRVAWHYSIHNKTNTKLIFIDDLLYHRNEKDYVDNWNIKVCNGEINLANYKEFVPFQGF